MKLSVIFRLLLTGCCCLSPVAVTAESENIIYGKVGDQIVLKPSSVPERITSLTWKDVPNIAMQWDFSGIDSYRQFEERGHLNISTGEMTIKNLTLMDSGVYKVEINQHEVTPQIRLIVLSPVPVPTVNKDCNDDTSCVLTCDGNITDAKPVTYTWKLDEKVTTNVYEHRITKEESLNVRMFSCEMKNPVSQASSHPISNPFTSDTSTGMHPKTIAGLVVFIGLLAPVVLLAVLHRWKAGVWFYEKVSMPWEADFWKNEKIKTRGSANTQEENKAEETLMT